jgi:DNA mismatch endonuclease, patch repair protein
VTAAWAAGRPARAARTRREASAAASTASTPGVRSRMQLQRTRDTAPELAVRRLLHRSGLRYRVDLPPLPGMRRRADIVFGPAKVAVYIDGCFWHGCPQHGNQPRANSEYWEPKLHRNRERDAETDQLLAAAGWTVLRAWEHEAPAEVAARVEQSLGRLRRLSGQDLAA